MYICKKCHSTYENRDDTYKCKRLECGGDLCHTDELLHGAVLELLNKGYDVASASIESKFDKDAYTSVLFYDNYPDSENEYGIICKNYYISKSGYVVTEDKKHEHDDLYEYKEFYIEKQSLFDINKDIGILESIKSIYEWTISLKDIRYTKGFS